MIVCVNNTNFRHLLWIKLIFLFQSASMTVLYPYLNLHMKSLGLSVIEAAVINAVVPILFIFTPPIAGFLADRSDLSFSNTAPICSDDSSNKSKCNSIRSNIKMNQNNNEI